VTPQQVGLRGATAFSSLNANLCRTREPEEMLVDEPNGALPAQRVAAGGAGIPSTTRRAPGHSPAVFHRAAAVLMAKHHVTEYVAFRMLVDRSVDSGRTVRETARAIIMESAGTA
jgi:hypothetical protein